MKRLFSRSRTRFMVLFVLAFTWLTCLSVAQQQAVTIPDSQPLDLKARGKEILDHLNASLRLYRTAATPMQKVGEPNDIVYRDQSVTLTADASKLAFQSAKAEALLMTAYARHNSIQSLDQSTVEQQRLLTTQNTLAIQLKNIKAHEEALDKAIAAGSSSNLAALRTQRQQLTQADDLTTAMQDAIEKITGASDTQGSSELANDINTLERSVPELNSNTKPIAASLTPLDSSSSAGISSQTIKLFQLLSTERSLDALLQENDSLHIQAQNLRAPIAKIMHELVVHGQQLSSQAMQAPPAPAPVVKSTKAAPQGQKANAAPAAQIPTAPAPAAQSSAPATPSAEVAENLDAITAAFKSISAASVPLGQEIVLLEQNHANLEAWRTSVNQEYKSILRALVLRLLVMAVALAVIFVAGELWTRATNKYVRESRRRRQLLLMRRSIVGILSAMVLLFGFVTQFDSLATFAGFITAGIAVGLQTILLSVAAYFFIIGKYGIKVGDRITIASVTGDVIDVGLVRFYVMELAGNGTELRPSGRVAIFSNSVLFQAGTPLYKQLPGSDYAWHELLVKLKPDVDYKPAVDEVLKVVKRVYDGYRSVIEKGHSNMEQWMQVESAVPDIESRLQFLGDSMQLWVRIPVQLRRAAAVDEELTTALLDLIEKNPDMKAAVNALPIIQPSVKG